MKRACEGSHVRFACLIVFAGALAGCGGDGGGTTSVAQNPSASPAPGAPTPITPSPGLPDPKPGLDPVPDPTPNPSPSGNSAPTITGQAPTTVAVGQTYLFKPSASDADNDRITFTIANKPEWANFDAASGELSGTPTADHIGTYPAIELAATDGNFVTALPAFTITVTPAGTSSSVTIAWDPPTVNEDGTPLSDLSGYRVHYGTASRNYSTTIEVDNPGLTEYSIDGLPPGTYYFALTSVDSEGIESDYSDEISATL